MVISNSEKTSPFGVSSSSSFGSGQPVFVKIFESFDVVIGLDVLFVIASHNSAPSNDNSVNIDSASFVTVFSPDGISTAGNFASASSDASDASASVD